MFGLILTENVYLSNVWFNITDPSCNLATDPMLHLLCLINIPSECSLNDFFYTNGVSPSSCTHIHMFVCVLGEGSGQGSCTRVVCCCSPQQMESVNISIRPCGSPQSSHCGGCSCFSVLITVNKSSIRPHFPPNRFPIDSWLTGPVVPSDRIFMELSLSGSSEISPRLLAALVGLHIFPFCNVLMPEPERFGGGGSGGDEGS